MTLSKDALRANLEQALCLILDTLGDLPVSEVPITESSPEYGSILPTTWQELRDRHYLQQTTHTNIHWMTGSGWYAALKVTGSLSDLIFKDKLSRLAATLKGYVKGRSSERIIIFTDIASDANLPRGFVYNAIESRILNYEFKIKGAAWTVQSNPKMVVCVPINFGHPSF